MQEQKPGVPIATKQYQHLHQDQGSPRTSTLEDPFGKTFQKLISILLLTENV